MASVQTHMYNRHLPWPDFFHRCVKTSHAEPPEADLADIPSKTTLDYNLLIFNNDSQTLPSLVVTLSAVVTSHATCYCQYLLSLRNTQITSKFFFKFPVTKAGNSTGSISRAKCRKPFLHLLSTPAVLQEAVHTRHTVQYSQTFIICYQNLMTNSSSLFISE